MLDPNNPHLRCHWHAWAIVMEWWGVQAWWAGWNVPVPSNYAMGEPGNPWITEDTSLLDVYSD